VVIWVFQVSVGTWLWLRSIGVGYGAAIYTRLDGRMVLGVEFASVSSLDQSDPYVRSEIDWGLAGWHSSAPTWFTRGFIVELLSKRDCNATPSLLPPSASICLLSEVSRVERSAAAQLFYVLAEWVF